MTKKLKGIRHLCNTCIFTETQMKAVSLTSDKKRSINEVKKRNVTANESGKSKSKKGRPSKKISSCSSVQNILAPFESIMKDLMPRCADQWNSSSEISSDDEMRISSWIISALNICISSIVNGINLPMSTRTTSSGHSIIKDFLEKHDLKQVNSNGTGYCCPYSAAFYYFNHSIHFSVSECSYLSTVK